MAVTVNVSFEVVTTGDGENQTDTFNWAPNPNAPRSPSKVLVNNNTTVSVPTNARGVIAVVPTAAGLYALKGSAGDTGAPITAGGICAVRFSAPGAVQNIVLFGNLTGIWTLYWT